MKIQEGELYHFPECLCQVYAIIKQVKGAYFESQTANDLDVDNASKDIFILYLINQKIPKSTQWRDDIYLCRCLMFCMMFIVQHIHFCTRIIFN